MWILLVGSAHPAIVMAPATGAGANRGGWGPRCSFPIDRDCAAKLSEANLRWYFLAALFRLRQGFGGEAPVMRSWGSLVRRSFRGTFGLPHHRFWLLVPLFCGIRGGVFFCLLLSVRPIF